MVLALIIFLLAVLDMLLIIDKIQAHNNLECYYVLFIMLLYINTKNISANTLSELISF